jgi:hypothetical protein
MTNTTTTTTTDDADKRDFIARASKLNENGAHYLVGWLISAGTQRPDVMTELERVLHEFETEPALQDCFAAEAKGSKTPREIEKSAPRPEKEKPAVNCETEPRPLAAVPTPTDFGKTNPTVTAKPERRSMFPKKLMQALFGKPSIAA